MPDESSFQHSEDIRLMIRARDGDRVAYDRLYARYFRTVESFLARHDIGFHACEDLAQEVFARIWFRRSRYRPLAPVKNYLYGVAANVLREDRAKSRARISLEDCDPEVATDTSRLSPPAHAQSKEQRRAVRALVASLPTRQRQAVELVYLLGLTPKEAARQLGCSAQTLCSRLHSARRKLRQLARPSK